MLLRASADKLHDKDTVREEGGEGRSDEEINLAPRGSARVVPSKLGIVLKKALVENDVSNVITAASSSAQKHREKVIKDKNRAGVRLKKRLSRRKSLASGSPAGRFSKTLEREKMLEYVRLQQRIQRIKEVQGNRLKEKRLATGK